MRRTARPNATKPAKRTPNPRTPAAIVRPRCSPRPRAPESSATASPLARKTSAKNPASTRPTRRTKRRRPPGHPPGPRHPLPPAGGNGSPSGHQGGRMRDPWNPGRRQGGPKRVGRGSSLIGEPIPHAVDGEQVPGPPVARFHLLADVLHVG